MAITIIVGALCCIGLVLSLLGTWAPLNHYLIKKPPAVPPLGFFPISILKPLKGLDFELEANLESYFNLVYPEYELLFALTSDSEPAYPVAKKLIEKYPHIKAKILVNPDQGSGNPKVSNLLKVYETATYDWVLISDSNVFMDRDYIKILTRSVDANTGVASAFIGGFESQGFFGNMEATFLNGFYSRWGLTALQVGIPCVVGKTMLFQRSVANRFGGIQSFTYHIAEDFMMGVAMGLLGKKVVIANNPVKQRVGIVTRKQFWDRHLRWGRLRKRQAPPAFFTEILFQPLTVSAFGSLFLMLQFGFHYLNSFLAFVCFFAVSDFAVMKTVNRSTSLKYLYYWLVRELAHYPLWIHIALGNTVNWRGQKYVIEIGGLVRTVND
ncbi:MAG: glycosyltransferase [Xanthomonadaceae bacterium]|nr:glycosyltransferase [Xanthomonadaceae bacterium]